MPEVRTPHVCPGRVAAATLDVALPSEPTAKLHGEVRRSASAPGGDCPAAPGIWLPPDDTGAAGANWTGRINRKVVQRLHRAWGLPLIRGARTPKPSGIRRAITAAGNRINLVAGRQEIRPLEVAYTDFTELIYAGGRRKAYLIPILDHTSKVVLGWAVGERAVTSLALEAWEQARHSLRARHVDVGAVTIHHDQDPVFTSYAWTARLLLKDQVRVSYALGGAQDNTEMEAFNSRFKTENRSLMLDVQSLTELKQLVGVRMLYYNNVRRHSSIGYRAPSQFIATLQPWS